MQNTERTILPHAIRERQAAFTLIELMVAVSLLLIIMVGVNTVFTSTSGAIGANQSISALQRESRALQATLQKDFGSIASDGPSIIIKGRQVFAFNSKNDELSDADGDPSTADFTGSGAESAQAFPNYSTRSHRVDLISFFTRQLMRRQTGNNGTFMANQSSYEQWVWLGHLRSPDDAGVVYSNPGDGTDIPSKVVVPTNPFNANNALANQWALGRMAMLLVQPDASGFIYDSTGATKQVYYSASAGNLAPLSFNTNSSDSAYSLQQGRYDIAGTTISQYSTILSNYAYQASPPSNWYVDMMGGTTSRFQAISFLSRPLTSAGVAARAPILSVGVSQFMVEYAGDFLNQDPTTGAVTDTYMRYVTGGPTTPYPSPYVTGTTDGLTDFVVNGSGPTARRAIRWYGMPRSTSGNPTITAANGDVTPLRDSWQVSAWNTPASQIQGAPNNRNAPFEQTSPGSISNPSGANILATGVSNYLASTASNKFYICAWGPRDTVRPKLYRIVMTLEDPNGRLTNGQTFEYIFSIP